MSGLGTNLQHSNVIGHPPPRHLGATAQSTTTSAARQRRSITSADERCEWGPPQPLLAVAPWPQLGERSGHHNQLLLKEQLSAAPATNPPILILASPFSRTMETARLVAAEVGVDPSGPHFLVRDELVERDFGSDNESQPYAGRYEAVWAEDQRDSQHPAGSDGESVVNVAERLRALLQVSQDSAPNPAVKNMWQAIDEANPLWEEGGW
ncbi:uncharacterized protein HaLaN_22114, partial [Haematococcus lacustris]